MLLFRNSNRLKYCCDGIKPFHTSGFCKPWIHLCMLVIFSVCRCLKVFKCASDHTGRKCSRDLNLSAFKKFKKSFGMFLLLICGLFKNCRYLNVTLFFCLACKICITIASLRFSCKSRKNIYFGLTSFKRHNYIPPFLQSICQVCVLPSWSCPSL